MTVGWPELLWADFEAAAACGGREDGWRAAVRGVALVSMDSLVDSQIHARVFSTGVRRRSVPDI